jgi:hypothetical protein
MDISTLANLVNAIAVTAGVIFAATQIRDYRRQRRRESMLSLVRSSQSPTFAQALRRVVELPSDTSGKQIQEILGPNGEDIIGHLTGTWESIRVLVFSQRTDARRSGRLFQRPDRSFLEKTAALRRAPASEVRPRHLVGVLTMAGRTNDGARIKTASGTGVHRASSGDEVFQTLAGQMWLDLPSQFAPRRPCIGNDLSQT